MNRGLARRTMFERGLDMQVFERQLESACDRGELEVHAYALMSTHYPDAVLGGAGGA